jgi:hypothetical protein
MRTAEQSPIDRNTGDFWLSVPQAVYLEATRDIETAVKLPEDGPTVQVINVMRRLSWVEIPNAPGAGRKEALAAVQNALDPRRGRYGAALRKLEGKLLAGLLVKGRRGLGSPLEVIDPAEFTGLELSDVNAVSRQTGEVVWHDLRISARAQVEILAEETQVEPWDPTVDPLPMLIEWGHSLCDGDFNRLPGRAELLQLHRKRFGQVRGISQHMMRELRRRLASETSKKGGSPRHRR